MNTFLIVISWAACITLGYFLGIESKNDNEYDDWFTGGNAKRHNKEWKE